MKIKKKSMSRWIADTFFHNGGANWIISRKINTRFWFSNLKLFLILFQIEVGHRNYIPRSNYRLKLGARNLKEKKINTNWPRVNGILSYLVFEFWFPLKRNQGRSIFLFTQIHKKKKNFNFVIINFVTKEMLPSQSTRAINLSHAFTLKLIAPINPNYWQSLKKRLILD